MLPQNGLRRDENDVVEASLQQNQQIFTGDTGLPFRLGKNPPELSFEDTVTVACFLFFPELQGAVGKLGPPAAQLLSRWFRSLIYAAFGCETTVTL